ncbi:hypothetical protein SLA2020_049750 [Shorea laevis]
MILLLFLPLSPLTKWSYGNPIFKEKDVDRGGDLAKSSNVLRSLTKWLELICKEQTQTMQRLMESHMESSRHHTKVIKQYMAEMRHAFEEGTRVMQETRDESRKMLQAISNHVVEQVCQPKLKYHCQLK